MFGSVPAAPRHPEARAKRASKDDSGKAGGRRPSRAACGGHLRVTGLALLALIANPLPLSAQAQSDYPNKPITLVVPLPPGGTNDILARAIADKMTAALGQQVVVENRASGGSGTVASRAVARGPADGYTLLLAYTTTLATAPYILPDVGYDVRKDFAPVGLIGYAPALLLVHANESYRNTG